VAPDQVLGPLLYRLVVHPHAHGPEAKDDVRDKGYHEVAELTNEPTLASLYTLQHAHCGHLPVQSQTEENEL